MAGATMTKLRSKAQPKARSKSTARPQRAKMSDAERETRVELAAAFRVAHHLDWNNKITNHITARIPDEPGHFLMNPHGYGWHEITASNLVKVKLDGTVLTPGANVGPAGLNFHSAILAAKPGIASVIHTHTQAGVVVSAMKCGLMIVDQTGCALHGQVGYHDFEGYANEKDEAPRILADLSDRHTLVMRNHGLLSIGRPSGEAFAYMHRLIDACALQVELMSTGAEINQIPDGVLAHTRAQIDRRYGNKPYGGAEWKMCVRLAAELDPKFAV